MALRKPCCILCLFTLLWMLHGCSITTTEKPVLPLMYLPNQYTNTIDNPLEHQSEIMRVSAIIHKDKSNVNAYFDRAKLYIEAGQFSDAIDDLNVAISVLQLDHPPDNKRLSALTSKLSEAYVQRGISNWHGKKQADAIADYTEAIRYDSKNWHAFFHRWQTYRYLHDDINANKDRQQGMILHPKVFKSEYAFKHGLI